MNKKIVTKFSVKLRILNFASIISTDIFINILVEHSFMSSSMEKIKLDYSLKNIPTPDKNTYELLLIEKIEAVGKHMRWKLFWTNNR